MASVDPVDAYFGNRFGYNDINTKEELFRSNFFTEHIKKNNERKEQFLKKNDEGSQGPCRFCKSLNTKHLSSVLANLLPKQARRPIPNVSNCGSLGFLCSHLDGSKSFGLGKYSGSR